MTLYFPTRRVTAGAAAVTVAAAGFVGAGIFSPAAADVTLEKSFDYKCAVVAGGLDLGVQDIGVRASTTVPETVAPGQVIPETQVNITLTMPELLRQSTALLLGGREADGASTDSAVTLTTGGETTTIAIPNLGSARTPIPQVANEPWLIPAQGTVPPITTPAYAVDSVVVGMPKTFNIDATIYKADNSTIPSSLSCTGPDGLALGSIGVTAPTTPPTSEPTTAPTTEPTTTPTTEPTTAPTTEPTTAPTTEPTTAPTTAPTTEPTTPPTTEPTTTPTTEPTTTPTTEPTDPTPSEPVDLSKEFTYKCSVIAGGLDLGLHDIGVLAETTVPGSVRPGELISERGVDITLTMPELLRESTVQLLGGTAAEGSSKDSAITLTSGGKTTTVAIPSLAAPRTDIPQQAAPWLIPATGTVPAIRVPADAADKVGLGMPAKFTITAKIYTKTKTLDSSLACDGPAELALGDIPVSGEPVTEPTGEPTSPPTSVPTTSPTDEPTSPPTSVPTTSPTTSPTDEPTDEPTDGSDVAPVELLGSDVVAPGDTITFSFTDEWIGKTVRFELRSKPVSLGSRVVDVSGQASVRIPTNAPEGSHTLRVYSSSGAVIAAIPIEVEAADDGSTSGDSGDDTWTNDVLASTGGPALGAAVLGGALLLGGIGVIVLRRRTARN